MNEKLFNKNEMFYSILHSCTYNWTIENYEKNTIIVTNNPFNLSFFGGYSTVTLPGKKWYKNPRPEDMASVLKNSMLKVGAQVLVLFEYEVNEARYGSKFLGLFNKSEENDAFMLVHECSDGVVYSLKE